MRYNLSAIMSEAWRHYRAGAGCFAHCLRMAWHNAKRTALAKESAGVTEDAATWYGWKLQGFEVIHGSKATFKVNHLDPSTKSGGRTVCYFTRSQVQPIEA